MLHVTHTQVFAEANFIELDATYHAASEMEHLINAVTLNYTTMHCKLNVQVMFIIRSGHVHVATVLWIIVSFPSPHLGMVVVRVRVSQADCKG